MTNKEQTGISRKKCSELMTKNVQTATRDTSLSEIANMMRSGDMGAVPIVHDGKLVGIITDRDIVIRAVAAGKGPDSHAGEFMTDKLFTVGPDDFAFEAIRLMGDKQIRRVPVINETSELVGIIAMADIALETEDEREIAETLEEISTGAGFWNNK